MEEDLVLYCHCALADVVPDETKQAALEALVAGGVEFEAVADLCGLAARKDELLARIAASGRVTIAACHSRAVEWLFAYAGSPLPAQGVTFVNLRTQSPEEVSQALRSGRAPAAEGCACAAVATQRRKLESHGPREWVPWYPVIDYDRCVGCGQCLSFCIFGVFAESPDGAVEVEHPENCKTNCPACARVCPQVAIIFPKHPTGPINGSDEPGEEPVAVDLAAIVAGDVLEILRRREAGAKRRFSGELDRQQAEAERAQCSCSAGILEKLGVSPEVLAAAAEDAQLPPPHAAKPQRPCCRRDDDACCT